MKKHVSNYDSEACTPLCRDSLVGVGSAETSMVFCLSVHLLPVLLFVSFDHSPYSCHPNGKKKDYKGEKVDAVLKQEKKKKLDYFLHLYGLTL